MEKSRVLVIADDEWMSTVLTRHLENAGFEVAQASEARSGFEQALKQRPDCVICDDELPDVDGYWVVDRIRREPGRVNVTPILLLIEEMEALQGVNVGADLFLNKPLNNDEVVAQVSALIDMARRLRRMRDSGSLSSTMDGNAALRGDISQMSVTTVMTVLEMERRTGQLSVEGAGEKRALFTLFEGALYDTRLDARKLHPLELLREVLRWKQGKFSFTPDSKQPLPGVERHALGMILLEAARLEDESTR